MKTLTLITILSFTLISCGKGSQSERPPGPPEKTTVELESLTRNGCLHVPLYLQNLHSLSPRISVLEVTTGFDLKSKKAIRESFRQLMAYTTFQLGYRPISEMNEFESMRQVECESLTFLAADGTEETYAIKEHSENRVLAYHEDGRSLEYEWLGPQRLRIETRYFAYDLPCTKGDPVTVRHRKVLDWSALNLTTIGPEDAPFVIEPEYLALVSRAVGRDASSLYQPGPDGERVLLVANAADLSRLPPREEILTCGNYLPGPSEPGQPESPSEPRTPAEPEPSPGEESPPEEPDAPEESPEEAPEGPEEAPELP